MESEDVHGGEGPEQGRAGQTLMRGVPGKPRGQTNPGKRQESSIWIRGELRNLKDS